MLILNSYPHPAFPVSRFPFPTLLLTVSLLAQAGASVEFNRDIRPILTKHCTACHGGVKSAGGVSFVYREKALGQGKSGETIIVPRQPEASELMRRITSADPDEVMPQPDHGPPLSPDDIAKLRQWIAEGAGWSEHWSLVPPVEPPVPSVKEITWMKQPLDAFIKARLENENLTPGPAATPAEWLRRVSLDLTGLPPSLEDFAIFQAAFVKDPDKAREATVDALLASPAYGERQASDWLDLARYADTFGYEKDPHRDIWPWRDWVIRSLNDDLPFDQFTIRQLAGDQLPHPTTDDLLATAFHRNTQNNTEGGTNDEEFRAVAVVDRVNTTWTTWQATTFGCVQCHAHPYDPYPHEDYYRFMAFFDNTEDADLDSDFPHLPVAADPAGQGALAGQWKAMQETRRRLNDEGVSLTLKDNVWHTLMPTAADTTGGSLTILPDGRLTAGGTLPVGVSYTVSAPAVNGMTAVRLEIFPDDPDPKSWPERSSVLSHGALSLTRKDGVKREVRFKEVIADFLAGPFDPAESLDGGPGGFGSYPAQAGGRWCVLVLEQPLEAGPEDVMILTLKQSAVSNASQQACTLRNFVLSTTVAPHWKDLMESPSRRQAWDHFRGLQAAVAKVPATQVPVLEERATAAGRETRVWTRGNRLTKGAPMQPGIPGKLNPPEVAGRMSRIDMARWLVSGNNSLTARVLANRLWAGMFGRGIVETLEDFGSSGALPTHPELLDHLALRISRTHAWSLKKLLREIALSATYAQSSRATADLIARDPSNVLLARGPRQRLTAEMVRDHALKISGLLSRKMSGPPVYPPQPEGVWNSVYSGQTWKTSAGEDRYRRAVYTYLKRTSGYPGFLAFDAPARDLCSARRLTTNTPLQALVTMNDPAYLEMATALAQKIAQAGGTVVEQIARACRQVTLEEPPAQMVAALTKLHGNSLTDYRARPDTAKTLGGTPEAAAMTLVMNTLLNSDPALNR